MRGEAAGGKRAETLQVALLTGALLCTTAFFAWFGWNLYTMHGLYETGNYSKRLIGVTVASGAGGVVLFLGGWALAFRNLSRWRAAVRESEERYALAIRGANDGLWDWDLLQNRIYFSPRWKSMLGCDEEAIGSSPDEWLRRIHPQDGDAVLEQMKKHLEGELPQFESEHRMQHRDGTWRWMLSRGVAVRDGRGRPYRMAGSQTDVTARRQAEEELRHGVYHDALTALPNRLYFMQQLTRTVGRTRRRADGQFAVLFLDLDRFKYINDTYGHATGDQVLVTVARRLEQSLRPGDTAARLGGDEFTVLLEDLETAEDAFVIAERIQKLVASPLDGLPADVWTSPSIGIACCGSGYASAEEVMQDADAAMYRAKMRNKARAVAAAER